MKCTHPMSKRVDGHRSSGQSFLLDSHTCMHTFPFDLSTDDISISIPRHIEETLRSPNRLRALNIDPGSIHIACLRQGVTRLSRLSALDLCMLIKHDPLSLVCCDIRHIYRERSCQ